MMLLSLFVCLLIRTAVGKPSTYKLLSTSPKYSGWRTVTEQTVLNTETNKTVSFEVLSQKHPSAVTILPFCTKSKTFTLVREYQPGGRRKMLGPAAGLVEAKKHDGNFVRAAREELREECGLTGGTLIRLTKGNVIGDKYDETQFGMFLLLDGDIVDDEEEDKRDAEEADMQLESVRDVTLSQLEESIDDGEMNMIGVATIGLGLRELRRRGLLE